MIVKEYGTGDAACEIQAFEHLALRLEVLPNFVKEDRF
jgi:hypothetical protein